MMIDFIYIILLAFLTGIIVKFTDFLVDNKVKFLFKNSEILFGSIYGILIGIMISNFPMIAPLWIGIVLGIIFSGKLDAIAHIISLPFVFLTVYILGFNHFSFYLTILFTIVCILEEIFNDYIDKKMKNKKPEKKDNKINKIYQFLRYRPLVEITALIVSIFINTYSVFFAIIAFDIGYIGVTKFVEEKYKSKHVKKKNSFFNLIIKN